MKNKIQIFCFHRVSDEFSPAYPPIPIKVFLKILSFINKNYIVIPIEEIHQNFKVKKPRLILTFDDAYYDFYENALPLLYKFKFSAIQHVITHSAETGESFWTQKLNKLIDSYYINKQKIDIPELKISFFIRTPKDAGSVALKIYFLLLDSENRYIILKNLENNLKNKVSFTRMMNWNDLNECTKYNIRIGSHTHTHATLTHISEQDLFFELKHSRKLITDHIKNADCLSLAFPNGKYNQTVIDTAKKIGYKYLLGTEPISIRNITFPQVLPRISLYNYEWWKNYLKLLLYRYHR